jgi:hypothetical protein
MRRRIALPLLRDRHNHPSLYAALRDAPSLAGLRAAEATAQIESLPRDRLSIVFGWRSDLLPHTAFDRGDLPPSLVVNWSLHGFAATSSAKPHIARMWPELAERVDDAAWQELHLHSILAFYGRVSGLDGAKLSAFFRNLADAGFGAAEDLAVISLEALRGIAASPLRDRIAMWTPLDLFRALSPGDRAACAGAKLFLDGALGARTAALDAPFRDAPAGPLLYDDDALDAALAEVASLGARPAVHAIGHRAIEQIVSALERLACNGVSFGAPRIEHAQFVTESQARRARDLGCVLSMQPCFNPESRDYADRLDERHLGENNPLRMVIDRAGFEPGADLLFGTDGMPADVAYALAAGLFPPCPGQRLSIDELAAGFGAAPGGGTAVYDIDDDARTVWRVTDAG